MHTPGFLSHNQRPTHRSHLLFQPWNYLLRESATAADLAPIGDCSAGNQQKGSRVITNQITPTYYKGKALSLRQGFLPAVALAGSAVRFVDLRSLWQQQQQLVVGKDWRDILPRELLHNIDAGQRQALKHQQRTGFIFY